MDSQELVIRGELTLAVNLAGTAMFAAPASATEFDLVLSGPPGGPLSFLAWRPLPEERGVGGIEQSVRRVFRLPPGPLSEASTARIALAGAERDALCFIENDGFARTAWCLVSIEHEGAVELVAFGCGVGGGVATCSSVLEHPSLRLLAGSLRVLT